jgi:hypothetical protein
MINEINYNVSRQDVEWRWAGRTLTDQEWYIIMGEAESLLERYMEWDMPNTMEMLPDLVEQDNKKSQPPSDEDNS